MLASCGHGARSAAPVSQLATTPSPAAATPTPIVSHKPNPVTTHKAKPVKHDDDPVVPFACKKPSPTPSPHFNTPEAAMRYLAAAWNRHDFVALCHVTNPDSRGLLNGMHGEAVNLRLNHCEALPDGTYECYFDHDYPTSMHKRGHGHAEFHVSAARKPGWYMSAFEGCG
jgi:hypothetical protein